MALEIILSPDSFTFARNPVAIDLAVDDRIAVAGVYYSRTITFTAGAGGGDQLDITFNGINVVMDAQAAPITEDGAHFRTQGADTLADWIANFVEDLQRNYYIAKAFTLTANPTNVVFTAREYGPEYAITIADMPGTYVSPSATAGVSESQQAGFRIMAEIHADTREQPITLELYKVADTYTGGYDGHFRARLEEVLHRLVSAPAPDGSLIDMIEMDDKQLVRYFLRYYEIYGSPPTVKHYYENLNDGDYFYAAYGGIKKTGWPSDTFFTDNATEVQFLTWMPRNLKVTQEQPYWLYWHYTSAASKLNSGRVHLEIYYTDGTSSGHNILTYTFTSGDFKTCYFPAGYYQIVEPNKTSGKTVSYWTVKLVEDEFGTTQSEVYTFTLEPSVPTHSRMLVFCNSLGGYDTLRTTGETVEGIDITGEILEQYMEHDYAREDAEIIPAEPVALQTFTFNTGIMEKKAMLSLMQELLTTRHIYEAEQAGATTVTYLSPLAIERGSIRIKRDLLEQDGFFLSFQAVSGHRYIGHSEIVS